jgi:protein-histidine pros-kinase
MFSIASLIASASYLLSLERAARRLLEQGLRDANLNLEQQVVNRTAALTEAKSRLAAFAVEQEHLIEAERKRLSREVHDQIGATFAGLKLILRGLPEADIPRDQLQALLMAVDMGVVTARRIATELRPPLLDDLGLQAALEQLLDTMSRGGGPLGAVDLKGQDRLSQDQAISLYRIVQEAVSNVVHHAKARHFVVRGYINGDDDYRLMMTDDGIGLGVVEPRKGALGLAGMRERAELMRGRITIEDGPDGGVLITLVLPLEPRKNDNAYENTAA